LNPGEIWCLFARKKGRKKGEEKKTDAMIVCNNTLFILEYSGAD
jgi:hypothetical protein